MTCLADQPIPSADVAPGAPGRSSAQRALTRRRYSRRAMLRLGVGSGMAVGLAVVGWLPPARLPRAAAEGPTEHPDCTIYSYDGELCIGGDVSSDYCYEGFHRDDTVTNGCEVKDYNALPTHCNGRAAWRWPDGDELWRCADGELWLDSCGSRSHTYTICSFRLDAAAPPPVQEPPDEEPAPEEPEEPAEPAEPEEPRREPGPRDDDEDNDDDGRGLLDVLDLF